MLLERNAVRGCLAPIESGIMRDAHVVGPPRVTLCHVQVRDSERERDREQREERDGDREELCGPYDNKGEDQRGGQKRYRLDKGRTRRPVRDRDIVVRQPVGDKLWGELVDEGAAGLRVRTVRLGMSLGLLGEMRRTMGPTLNTAGRAVAVKYHPIAQLIHVLSTNWKTDEGHERWRDRGQ